MNIPAPMRSTAKELRDFSSRTFRAMTNEMRLLPDFLIIGGQRCGTTSLYYYLINYPSISSAHTKEVHFFDVNFNKGLRWYRAQFPTTLAKSYARHVNKHPLITGEASPYYLFHPHAPRRIAEVMPNVKLIALLRNPIDRAFSQHWLEVQSGFEKLSFKDALASEEERLAGEWEKMLEDEQYHSFNYRHYSYLERGKYADQLQFWIDHYPKEQLLVLKSEDLYTRPAEVVEQTLKFLGVYDEKVDLQTQEYKKYKLPLKSGYKSKQTPSVKDLDPELKRYLVDYFRPHNDQLATLLGRDFGWNEG